MMISKAAAAAKEKAARSCSEASGATPAILTVEGLTVSFQEPVVRDLSLRLDPGEVLTLVGESGSGKTITCLALLGLLPPSAKRTGSICIAGNPVSAFSEEEFSALRGRTAAMIFQEPRKHLDPSMKMGDQIEEVLRYSGGLSRAFARERSRELLDSVGLDASRVAASFPHELSGGMCQRAAIALAISCDPALLLADEPTTALDASIQRSVLDLLLEIVDSRGMGMIFVTHDLRAVSYVADTVAVMLEGLIVERGPRDDILSRPLHPYTRLLIDSIPGKGFLARKRSRTGVPRVPGGCPFFNRCPVSIPECAKSLPPETEAGGRAHRCLRPGAWL